MAHENDYQITINYYDRRKGDDSSAHKPEVLEFCLVLGNRALKDEYEATILVLKEEAEKTVAANHVNISSVRRLAITEMFGGNCLAEYTPDRSQPP